MSATPTQPEAKGILSKVRIPAAFLLGFLLVLGAYYFLYAQKKTTYLVGRNFRLLATMGDEIRDSATSYGKFLESKGPEELSGLRTVTCDADPARIFKGKEAVSDPLLRLRRAEGPLEIAAFNSNASQPGIVCARLDPEKLFAPLLNPSFKEAFRGAFDRVLLARDDGEVFFQFGASDLRITRLDPLLLDKSGAGGGKDSKPSAGGPGPALFAAAGYRNVEIGGKEYKLFVQPVDLPMGTHFAGDAHETWLLCGLVVADTFVYNSLAVPSSLLLVFLAVLLLAALSWPLVRLRMIGEWQRVRVFDVLLLGICSLLGVAILTLALLDFHAYAELQNAAESQLQALADQMAGNISREIVTAHHHLQELEKRSPRQPPAQSSA
jgi:hypothetical protein